MMIEHKYLNWLKWTARAVIKLFSFIGIAFNTLRVASKRFNQSAWAPLSRCDSLISPNDVHNLPEEIITRNIVCDLHVTKHDDRQREIVSGKRFENEPRWQSWKMTASGSLNEIIRQWTMLLCFRAPGCWFIFEETASALNCVLSNTCALDCVSLSHELSNQVAFKSQLGEPTDFFFVKNHSPITRCYIK